MVRLNGSAVSCLQFANGQWGLVVLVSTLADVNEKLKIFPKPNNS